MANIYKISGKICLILLSVFMLAGMIKPVFADEAAVLSPEEALLALINEARRHPLDVAAEMGLDPEKILADLPELENILTNGMSPLTFNENLAEAAFSHTWDMFAQSYYSTISPDGRDHGQRIDQAGYPAVLSGESLGMILFANFIKPEDAARLIFEYMFADELDPSRTEQRNILNPCLKEAGISIQSGTLVLNGGRWNVYLATCDFGSLLSCAEGELFELINQARENPLETAASLGLDTEQIVLDLPPEMAELVTQGMRPLTFHMDLGQAARGHAADMLENGFYSHVSSDGLAWEERICQAGYSDQPIAVGESIWRACLGSDDEILNDFEADNYDQIQKLVRRAFRNMLACELRPNCDGEKNIFNEAFTEIGIGLAAGVSPELETLCGDRVLLMVINFGARVESSEALASETVAAP